MTQDRTTIHLPKSKQHGKPSRTNSKTAPAIVPPSAAAQSQHYAAASYKVQHQQQSYHVDASHDISITGDGLVYLVSDSLYFEVPQAISDHDIFTLLLPCQPLSIQRNKQNKHAMATGWIRFLNKESADCAYTLFDGLVFRQSHRLQLYMTPNGIKDPEPEGPIFQVDDIPYWVTNEYLYHVFRPFGPIRLCKILVDKNGTFEGSALLQYFSLKHANHAQAIMSQRSLDGLTPLSIFSLVSTKTCHEVKQSNKSETSIDFTNLYIKNLDLAVKSSDLFSTFKEFGRIISARVMKDPMTKQSRGYGFVSFSSSHEAKQALETLNGQCIMSKPVTIAYHEPKKKTKHSPSLHASRSLPESAPPHSPYALPAKPSNPALARPSHIASDTSPSPDLRTHAHSPLTDAPSSASDESDPLQVQCNRVRSAIITAMRGVGEDPQPSQLQEWTDTIMALRPTSRALCLFNPSFLMTKLEEAAAALSSTSSSPVPQTPNLVHHHRPRPPNSSVPTIAHATSSTTTQQPNSNSSSVTSASSGIKTDVIHMHGSDTQVTIDRFVESIKNLSILQQKQQLGDLLFPHVKATGVKHASKVTIRLLDTQPLDQLAYAMRTDAALKPLVDRAFNQVVQQLKFKNAIMQK
ncbi:hypothetical protein DM01DRAFT_1340477 [Hesseltinella vesiculosa]|uniref:Uncharacterized protein n=1 Tax=Hesseltinella vesiculosa TaxID=101127 RepID=A0A1X2G3S1_9FUNG|nr:hypothetical protein DM01DRAFT_1340477 [Hesseltinella vesiculosa]